MNQVKTGLQRIKKITESIIGLPTLPTVVSKMIDQVDSPRTSTAALARLISSDQALTAKVLKIANPEAVKEEVLGKKVMVKGELSGDTVTLSSVAEAK